MAMEAPKLTDFRCNLLPSLNKWSRYCKTYEDDPKSNSHALLTFAFDIQLSKTDYESMKYMSIDYKNSPILSLDLREFKPDENKNKNANTKGWKIEMTTLSGFVYIMIEKKDNDFILSNVLLQINIKELAIICAKQKSNTFIKI